MSSVGEVVDWVVQEHFDIEAGLQQIAVFSEDGDSVLRLIEVNKETIPTGQVQPFVFSPSEEVPVPIFIADVTPDEWKEIQDGRISLPKGWPSKPLKIFNRN